MILIALVGALLAGLLTWKFITVEDNIKELRARVEELEDEKTVEVIHDIDNEIPF